MAERNRVTRRQLLGGAATVGIPYIIPSGVLAQNGRPGANDRIVFGHIGVGGMGRSHIVPGSAAAICDVDDNSIKVSLDQMRKQNSNFAPAIYKDFRKLLERKDIDAVTIGTPDHWHAVMTVMACQAGKDVYSEKPTMRTIEEGRAMVNAARRYKRVVQIGMQGRSNGEVHKAAEFVRNGQIGRVKSVVFWHPTNFLGRWAP
jgi:predicted dehydrogenase